MSEGQFFSETERQPFRPYPKYKDSGVEWLGKIPIGWTVIPLKRSFDVKLGKMLQNEPQSSEDSLEPYLRAANISWNGAIINDVRHMWISARERNTFALKPGDLLVSEGGDVGRSTIWHGEIQPCYYQNAINRVRERRSDIIDYLYYWIYALKNAAYIDMLCSRATISHFTAEKVAALPVMLPSKEEQNAIISFLNRETAKIDALIEKNERLIELLHEKRIALINQAVTKGLNPDVPMKDSDVEWLGIIPAHWRTERNRWLFRVSDIRSKFGEEELLTVSHLTGVTRHSEKNVTMIEAESHEGYKICRAGELVINTMWAWMGALGIASEEGMASPSYNVYVLITGFLNPRYYDYLCRVPVHVSELTKFSKGIWKSRLRLYPDEFYEITTSLPPKIEQERIAEFLDNEDSKVNVLVKTIGEAIDHLKEYRTALISAAVTGKIDVRDA